MNKERDVKQEIIEFENSRADELKNELRLSYQRTKAVDDYLKDNIKDDEINKYFTNSNKKDSDDDGLVDFFEWWNNEIFLKIDIINK